MRSERLYLVDIVSAAGAIVSFPIERYEMGKMYPLLHSR